MEESSPAEIAHAFVAALNEGDLVEMANLLAEDHLFADACGAEVRGIDATLAVWAGYFGLVPDYRILVERTVPADDQVALFGRAGGTCRLGEGCEWVAPAAWLALVRDGKIAEWRVFADNEPLREIVRNTES